ncbi:Putative esterase [gamma proteobacterium HdN1]|nr:Putative esterase [gamma proteobacterium HdN1]
MELIEQSRIFEGRQLRLRHASSSCHCDMTLAIFLPPQAVDQSVPVVWWLSGLTCNDQNFTTKAGAQRIAAELGLAIIAPDTSPRGAEVPDAEDGAWDFGQGAGFYVNATQAPYDRHYQMADYIQQELPSAIQQALPSLLKDFKPLDFSRQSISGHSMGGHGALTLAIKHPEQYRSASAFAPICAPSDCPWGQKALGAYIGQDRNAWRKYDAVALLEDRGYSKPLLVDQGMADSFLDVQLMPDRLEKICQEKRIPLTLNRRAGYDHSYYFISTFIESHLRFHAEALAQV